jgi:hypothetical protein
MFITLNLSLSCNGRNGRAWLQFLIHYLVAGDLEQVAEPLWILVFSYSSTRAHTLVTRRLLYSAHTDTESVTHVNAMVYLEELCNITILRYDSFSNIHHPPQM